MFDLLLGSKFLHWLGAAVVAVLGVLGYGWSNRRKGARDAELKAEKRKDKRLDDGNKAVAGLRGADRHALDEQLRRNDGQWE